MNSDDTMWAAIKGILFGLAIGIFVCDYLNSKTIIQKGFAYYHPQTAQFTWKTNLVEKIEIKP